MTQAKHSLSRRTAIAGLAAALPAAAAGSASAAGTDPDAELIRLGEEWRRLWDYLDTTEAEDLPEKEWDVLFGRRAALEKAIWDTPARTVRGLGVKAVVAKEHDSGWGNHADYALLADVLRLSGQAA